MRPGTNPRGEAVRILREEGIFELVKRSVVFILKELLLIYWRFVDWISGRRLTHPFALNYKAKYRINHTLEDIPDLEFWYEFDSPHVRHRILGNYEVEVAEELMEIMKEESVFWEVGAAWGYHSLSIADLADEIVAFDPDQRRTDLLRKSCKDNGINNISIVSEDVSSLDDYLDKYPLPDVVLMDIEGGEYEVIPSSSALLKNGCIWIIEVHHNAESQDCSVDDIKSVFDDHGYDIETIREHYEQDWRGNRASDSLTTQHIVAYPQ
jgi:precorrin-6B methylase 2